jgi:hypothetical protein
MKHYKPTLKLVKNKWYVSMTVPFELRYLLTNQIRLSTSTSDKNEALKRFPELASKLKNKISNAAEQLKINSLKEKVFSIANKLNRKDLVNIDNLDKEGLIYLLKELSNEDGTEIINVGTYNVKNFKRDKNEMDSPRKRLDKTIIEEEETIKAKQILTEITGAENSFKQFADEWEKVNNWNREKTRKSYKSHIDKFLKVMGDLDLENIGSQL